jgi:hypothetical protein
MIIVRLLLKTQSQHFHQSRRGVLMFTRICCLKPSVCLLVLLLLASQTDVVSAQPVRQVPNLNLLRLKVVQNDLAHNNLVNKTFTPPLKKVLNAELHFLKKICDPTDEQFTEIHRAGLAEVNVLAQLCAIQQRARTKTRDFADPNARIASALSDAVREVIPDRESADRYAEEINARAELRRTAAAGMIVSLIDQQAFLDPAQQDSLAAALLENWNSNWSGAPVVVMYPMYSTLPEADLLQPHLTALQQKLWTYRPAQRTVRLPWDFELNVGKMLGVNELEAFPDPEPSGKEAKQ